MNEPEPIDGSVAPYDAAAAVDASSFDALNLDAAIPWSMEGVAQLPRRSVGGGCSFTAGNSVSTDALFSLLLSIVLVRRVAARLRPVQMRCRMACALALVVVVFFGGLCSTHGAPRSRGKRPVPELEISKPRTEPSAASVHVISPSQSLPLSQGADVTLALAQNRADFATALESPSLSVELFVGGTARSFMMEDDLQTELSDMRPGAGVEIRTFPLRDSRAVLSRLGLRLGFASERGTAQIQLSPQVVRRNVVSQTRWMVGAEHLLVSESAFTLHVGGGVGGHAFDVIDGLRARPSECPATSEFVCLPSVSSTEAQVHLRLGFRPTSWLTVYAEGRPSVGITFNRAPSYLASEASPRMWGAHGEVGGVATLTRWIGMRLAGWSQTWRYSFDPDFPLLYGSAIENYWGVRYGVIVVVPS